MPPIFGLPKLHAATDASPAANRTLGIGFGAAADAASTSRLVTHPLMAEGEKKNSCPGKTQRSNHDKSKEQNE